MESVSLEMDDIFGEQLQEDEDQLPQMLPDLPEADMENEGQGAQNEDETENKKVLDKLKGMKGASKNTVKRPMPKLDSVRLIGERGIPILPRIFKDVKLKGKGHEVDDLRVVMRYLEHWGHRLFPKMPFDEVLERVERLGAKRDVQTCIKKMRMDLPVLGSDTVSRGDGEEGEDEDTDKAQNLPSKQNPSAEELFDALIQEEEEMEAEVCGSRGQEGGRAASVSSPARGDNSLLATQSHSTASSEVSSGKGMSAEVLERIERNRRLAMEKRAKKLGIPVTTVSPHDNLSTQASASREAQDNAVLLTDQSEVVSAAANQPQVVSDVTSQPEVVSDVTSQPEVVSGVASQPEILDATNQPQVVLEATSQPEVAAEATSQPEAVSDVPNPLQVASEAAEQPDAVTDVTSQPKDVLDALVPSDDTQDTEQISDERRDKTEREDS
ncbi:uncharacterized protein LOC143282442 [Babylonia areolata]|uniref:uncharacterized protein LOC143282442 n=1 Tax=Babylonia areolata TaxID=304850 RepID=UPI003FD17713